MIDWVSFTMDTDWTPPEVLEYVFSEIVDERLPLTIFCTDPYPAAETRRHTEIALHYNMEQLGFAASYRAIAARLPMARGARGHSLAISERLRPLYQEFQTCYDSSYLMPHQPGIVPFHIARGVWEFPIYFMDMYFLDYYQGDFHHAPRLEHLAVPGLKVLDFHPVHLLLNTPSSDFYQTVKHDYHNMKRLLQQRYTGWGICSLFREMQAWALGQQDRLTTLVQLASALNHEEPH
jgi:hypothetical protein